MEPTGYALARFIRPHGTEIFTVRPDGTGEKRLTDTDTQEQYPTFSPDGKTIAYTGPGTPGISTINAEDGSGFRKLANSTDGEARVSFSPDGTQVAFQQLQYSDPLYGLNPDIFTMNVADDPPGQSSYTNRTATFPLADREPDWAIVPGSAPAPAISLGDASVTEGNKGQTQATFTVSLSRPFTEPVAVDYASADGSATAAGKTADYTATSGTLTFAAGETRKTVAVAVTGDSRPEPDETFYLYLSRPSGATLAESRGTGTIVNDDRQK